MVGEVELDDFRSGSNRMLQKIEPFLILIKKVQQENGSAFHISLSWQ